MANLVPVETFSDVYEIDIGDPVQGGPGGIDNQPHQALANRTEWLRKRVGVQGVWDMTPSESPAAPTGSNDLEATSTETDADNYEMTPSGGSSMYKLIGSGAVVVPNATTCWARLSLPNTGGNLAVVALIVANASATPADVAASFGASPTGTCTHYAGVAVDLMPIFGGPGALMFFRGWPGNNATAVAALTAVAGLSEIGLGVSVTGSNMAVTARVDASTEAAASALNISALAEDVRLYAAMYFTAAAPVYAGTMNFDLGDSTGGRKAFVTAVDPALPLGAADGKRYLVSVGGQYGGRQTAAGDVVELHSGASLVQVYPAEVVRSAGLLAAQADATQAISDAAAAQADATSALSAASGANVLAAAAQAGATQALADAASAQADVNALNVVYTLADLPTPVAGVITLPGNTYWNIRGVVNLASNVIECGNGVVIDGSGVGVAGISGCLVAGTPMITALGDLIVRGVSLGRSSGGALLYRNPAIFGEYDLLVELCEINRYAAGDYGVDIGKGNRAHFRQNAFVGDSSLMFRGQNSLIWVEDNDFSTSQPAACVQFDATSIVTSAIFDGNRFALANAAAIGIGSLGAWGSEGLMLFANRFVGLNPSGALDGLTPYDSAVVSRDNVGLDNTKSVGTLSMVNNGTATSIASSGVFYKAAGTTTGGTLLRFTHGDNRLTHNGTRTSQFAVHVQAAVQTTSNDKTLAIAIAKNGLLVSGAEMSTRCTNANTPQGVATFCPVTLATGDYVEVFVANQANTDSVKVSDLNVMVREV